MPETQHGDQIEQDQIAQFECAYELRSVLSESRKENELQESPETVDEMNGGRLRTGQLRTAFAKRWR